MQDAKRRAVIFAVLSVVFASVAAFLFLQESNQLYAGLGSAQTVLVAKKDINSREALRAEDFEAVEVPEKYMNQSMVTNINEIEGYVSVIPIGEGDVLTKNVLRPAAQLSDPKKRMVLLRGSERVLFDETFTSQDRVDIIVSYQEDPDTGEKKPQTKIFLRDKLIHAVAKGNKAIGLELSLSEAQELIYAENFAHSIRVVKAPQSKDKKEEQEAANNQPQQGEQQQGEQADPNQQQPGTEQGQPTDGNAGN